ncbi:MAG: hypothetical protein WDN10_00345 [bacterium]
MNLPWKKIIGVALIVIGLLALVTPFTPGSWLVFVGAEMVGARLLLQGKALAYYERLYGLFRKREEDSK